MGGGRVRDVVQNASGMGVHPHIEPSLRDMSV